MKKLTKSIAGLCGIAALIVANQAVAGYSWDFTNGAYTPTGVYTSSTVGGSTTAAAAGITSDTAYANTGGQDAAGAGQVTPANQTLQIQSGAVALAPGYTAGLTNQGSLGMGMTNNDACASRPTGSVCDLGDGTAPEHSIDNNERNEMVLLQFASSVKLSSVTIGWAGTDSDISVLAYVGTGAPVMVGKKWGELALDTNWIKVGNYADLTAGVAKSINSVGTFSSYWLIGADNALASPTGTHDGNSDYVKLQSVAGCIYGTSSCPPVTGSTVPEPGSLALVGFALAGVAALRRKKKN